MARPPIYNQHAYATQQERMRHDDAVLWYGEMTVFILWWSTLDFHNGLVDRCSTCFKPLLDIAEVYQQAPKIKCPNCYGTTFEGGFRALLYRPALWDHYQADQDLQRRGLTTSQTANVQPTTDFQMRDNDCAIRGDNTRWRITQPKQTELATGFGTKASWPNVLTSVIEAHLEDTSSVVYTVPVNLSSLTLEGWSPTVPYPHANDIINGPLTYD